MYWKIRKFVHLKQCFGKNFVEISLSIGGIQFDPDYAISRKIQRQSYWLLHRGTIFGKFPTLQYIIIQTACVSVHMGYLWFCSAVQSVLKIIKINKKPSKFHFYKDIDS